jgi:hypothetical protein
VAKQSANNNLMVGDANHTRLCVLTGSAAVLDQGLLPQGNDLPPCIRRTYDELLRFGLVSDHHLQDLVATSRALDTYREIDPGFQQTREHMLAVDLAEAINEGDSEKFSEKLFQYDQMSKLDKWKTCVFSPLVPCPFSPQQQDVTPPDQGDHRGEGGGFLLSTSEGFCSVVLGRDSAGAIDRICAVKSQALSAGFLRAQRWRWRGLRAREPSRRANLLRTVLALICPHCALASVYGCCIRGFYAILRLFELPLLLLFECGLEDVQACVSS